MVRLIFKIEFVDKNWYGEKPDDNRDGAITMWLKTSLPNL